MSCDSGQFTSKVDRESSRSGLMYVCGMYFMRWIFKEIFRETLKSYLFQRLARDNAVYALPTNAANSRSTRKFIHRENLVLCTVASFPGLPPSSFLIAWSIYYAKTEGKGLVHLSRE